MWNPGTPGFHTRPAVELIAIVILATTRPTAAARTAGLRRPLFAWARFIDRQIAAVMVLAMQRRNGGLRAFLGFHRDERKAAGPSALAVHDHIHRGHGSVGGEKVLEIVFGGVEGKVSNKQFR